MHSVSVVYQLKDVRVPCSRGGVTTLSIFLSVTGLLHIIDDSVEPVVVCTIWCTPFTDNIYSEYHGQISKQDKQVGNYPQ